LHESFTRKWWLSSKKEAWNLTKINFKICQLNENGLCICWLESEHNYFEKGGRKMHLSWMML